MPVSTLIRLAGVAALVAGVLRMVAAFIAAPTATVTLEWLYLVIDVLLLFGLIGVYAYQRAQSGLVGFIGFLLAVTGVEAIGGPDGKLGDIDVYTSGASLVGLGVLVLAVASWSARRLPRYVPILWGLSTLLGMLAFIASELQQLLFVAAGTAFGLGFVGAGLRLYADPHTDRTPGTDLPDVL